MLTALVAAVSLAPTVVVKPFVDGTARAAYFLQSLVGVHGVLDGNLIMLPERTLLVSRDCTAVYLVVIFTSLVACYRAPRSDKLRALAIGVPTLLLCNMVRLVGAGVVAQRWPSAFEVVHDYVFVVALMFAVVALWLAWVRTVRSVES